MFTLKDMYDLDHTMAKDYLQQYEYPWLALAGIKDLIISLGQNLPEEEYDEVSPQVWVHKTAKVFDSAYLGAPCIIGARTEVRHCAFIRGSALDDGEFEVILISAPNNLLDVNVILNKMLSGNTDDTHIIKLTASSITFEFDEEVIWTLDGEESKPSKTAEITCCNKAVNMLIHR